MNVPLRTEHSQWASTRWPVGQPPTPLGGCHRPANGEYHHCLVVMLFGGRGEVERGTKLRRPIGAAHTHTQQMLPFPKEIYGSFLASIGSYHSHFSAVDPLAPGSLELGFPVLPGMVEFKVYNWTSWWYNMCFSAPFISYLVQAAPYCLSFRCSASDSISNTNDPCCLQIHNSRLTTSCIGGNKIISKESWAHGQLVQDGAEASAEDVEKVEMQTGNPDNIPKHVFKRWFSYFPTMHSI